MNKRGKNQCIMVKTIENNENCCNKERKNNET